MCLAVPGKVTELYEENGLLMGNVDFSGTVNITCMAYVPEVKEGQYVIVHAGFAISILDEAEAQEVFKAWGELEERIRQEDARLRNNAGSPSDGKLN